MRPVILDCSIALAWCFGDETTDYTESVLEYVGKFSAIVPPLWLSEVANALLTAVKKERIDMDGSLLFLEKVSRLPIRIAHLSSREYFSVVFPLAKKHQLTAYDATYLFLAMREKKPLATLDADLRQASKKNHIPKIF